MTSLNAVKTKTSYRHTDIDEEFASDVLFGLTQSPKRLSSKYFYDDRGSRLFQQITDHEDYYPTDCEHEILQHAKTILPDIIREHSVDIVELGAGDGHKTRLLIDGFLQAGRSVNYFPIDISAKAMELLEDSMPSHPQLQQHNIVAEYFDGIDSINQLSNNRKLVLFLGSNIGNFSHSEAKEFLRHLQYHLNPGDYLLAGFDLKKDIATLNTAYNDSSGLTRDFNLNLLHRINKELHADFDVEAFDHYGTYNPTLGAMESYLLPKSEQTVNIKTLGKQINFTAYEPIHVEYSFKYLPTDIEQLADDSGFFMLAHFPDSQHYFIDSLWRAS